MARYHLIFALLTFTQAFLAFTYASSSDPNTIRLRNELRNANLEAEIAEVAIENRIKQAKNTIWMHVQESKTHIKASKDILKPNGMFIGACVENATSLMSRLPVESLQQCNTVALMPINQLLWELRTQESELHKAIFNCQINGADTASCIENSVQNIEEEANQIAQSIREEVLNVLTDTCVARIEKNIFEQLGDILNDFAICLENELVA